MQYNSRYFPLYYLTLTVLILPLIYFGRSLDPVLLPRIIVLSMIMLLFLIMTALKIARDSDELSFAILRNPIFSVFLLYVFFSLMALPAAINIGEGIFDITKAVLAMAVLTVSALIFHNYANSRYQFAKFIIISGLMLAIIGAFQYFGIGFGFLQSNGLPSGTSVNRNLFLALLAIIIPYSLYGIRYLSRVWRYISFAAGLLMLFLIVVGAARSVWVACLLSSAICLVLYLAFLREKTETGIFGQALKSRSLALLVSAVVVLIIAGGFFIAKNRGLDIPAKAVSIFDTNAPTNNMRIELWRNSIAMYGDHPIIGVGPGNWKVNIGHYGRVGLPGYAKTRFFQRPHNDFLWVLSEKGIPALIAYLGLFIMAIFFALKIIIKSSLGQKSERHFALFMLWGIIAYLADSFFSFPMERVLNFTFILLMIAAVVSLYEYTFKYMRRDFSKSAKLAIVLPLLTVVTLSGIIGYIRLHSEVHTKAALEWREKSDWNNVIREIKIAEYPLASLDPTATPLAWYSGEGHYMMGQYDSAFTDYLRAYSYNPNHLHVLNNLGTLYEMKGEHDKAIEMFERALNIHPDFNETLLNLTAVYYNTGQYEKANEMISRVATDCPDPRYSLFMQKVREKLK